MPIHRDRDGEHDLFGDERIVLVPLPGHTPGSIARARQSRSLRFVPAGRPIQSACARCSIREIIPRNTWNVEARRSRFAEIRRIEARGATVICGHDDRQWQTLRKGADAYD